MPITEFICPGGHKIRCSDCLKQCRKENECSPKTYRMAALATESHPAFSITTLIGSPYKWLLKKTHVYAMEPAAFVHSLIGRGFHSVLEGQATGIQEERLSYPGLPEVTGAFDYFDTETGILWDYKVKTEKAINRIIRGDTEGLSIQLSAYADMIEHHKGVKVTALKTFLASKEAGIRVVDIPRREVATYFAEKYKAFKQAEAEGDAPECETFPTECKNWCPVKDHCQYRRKDGPFSTSDRRNR